MSARRSRKTVVRLPKLWKDRSPATPYLRGMQHALNVTIRTRHFELSPALRDQLHRRLTFALGRLAASIRAVEVTIVDTNGPRGGADKLLRIRVRGASLPSIVIEQVGTDILSTVSLAAERAERAVVRSLARRRTFAPMQAS